MDDSSIGFGVIGTGRMGLQISQYLLENGFAVVLKTRDLAKEQSILDKLKTGMERHGFDAGSIQERLTIVDDFAPLSACTHIIESSAEDFSVKKCIFSKLSEICGPEHFVYTNTSSLSLKSLSQQYKYPGMLAGLHFFNPIFKMELAEIIGCEVTSERAIEEGRRIAILLKKVPVIVKDSPGFIVNRLLLPQINDAVRLYENGIATVEDIDSAVKLGLNHPMGPFALADLIGIDVCVAILDEIYAYTNDTHFLPVETLRRMVAEGRLGKKSGSGFYQYH